MFSKEHIMYKMMENVNSFYDWSYSPKSFQQELTAMASLTAKGITGCTRLSSSDFAEHLLAPNVVAIDVIFGKVTSSPAKTDSWNELAPWVSTARIGTTDDRQHKTQNTKKKNDQNGIRYT